MKRLVYIIVVSVITTGIAVLWNYYNRGYFTVGGEWLIPCLFVSINYIGKSWEVVDRGR